MSESFADLFNQSLQHISVQPGDIVCAQVLAIENDMVIVNAGLKSEAVIALSEFMNEEGGIEIQVGDEVDVAVDILEDGFGETRLSRERAKRAETWIELSKVHEAGGTIIGIITGKVKGGFTVEFKNVRAFLPGSLVDVRPVRDLSYLEGKPLEFKVIKLDQKRNNIVVSRRAVVESESGGERAELLQNMREGQELKGTVKNLTEYGAFIDLGGIDGLLHITDMSWKRIKHPSEVVNVGEEVLVKILKFDRERNRVSLGLKQLGSDPWADISGRYPVGTRLNGKVTNITDYGCFVEIENGIEGLVHVSEMDWTNKNIHPSKVVQVGSLVDVMVLEIDEERRRISLGVKQCTANPWATFAESHQKGDIVSGKIKSITDFGIFIGLDGGIDGLVHLSDISWMITGEEALRQFKKGDDLQAVILVIDPERERISLGIKQLQDDEFGRFADEHPKGSPVKGTVTAVDAKEATISLAPQVDAVLRASEMLEKTDDLSTILSIGHEVEARVLLVDRKTRTLVLSKRPVKESKAEQEKAAKQHSTTTLGDLLKEQMDGRGE